MKRYEPEEYTITEDSNGGFVLYFDHVEAMDEKDNEIKTLKDTVGSIAKILAEKCQEVEDMRLWIDAMVKEQKNI